MKGYREGFSLIEVIIAVAILAIVSVPILMYFTNSAIHSAHGRDEQAADMAAQTVIEQIDAMDDFEHVLNVQTELDKLGDGWTISSSNENQTVIYKPVSVNENSYVARATIDYSQYTAQNNYDNPHIPTLYSASSTVASETDESVIAVNRLYKEINGKIYDGLYAEDGSDPLAAIRSGLHRTISVQAKALSGSKDCEVKVKFIYSYNLKEAEYTLKETKLTLDEVKAGELCGNIFVLIKPLTNLAGEDADIDIDLGDATRKLGLTIVAQGATTSLDTYGGPGFDTVGTGNHVLYKNFGSNKNLVPTKTDKRIAYVTVDVFDVSSWTGDSPDADAKIEATSTTTKSV